MGNDAKLLASENFTNMLSREKAALWQTDYQKNSQLFYGGEIEQATRLLSLLSFARDIKSAGEINYLKSLLELSNLNLDRYLTPQQKTELNDALATFQNFLDFTMQEAQPPSPAAKNTLDDYVTMFQRKENQNVILLLYDNRLIEGQCSFIPDHKFNVYHALKVGGSVYQFMEIKAIYVIGPIEKRLVYYNDYLNKLPPRQAFCKKFGELIEIEMKQEIRAIERNKHF